MLVDTHCHLFHQYYDNIDEVLENARKCEVGAVIVNGTNSLDNREVLELVSKYDMVYGALGIQTEEIDDNWYGSIEFIERHICDDKILAVGEIGLDYHYDCDRDLQKQVFRKQLEIAEKYNKPVIVHSRDCIQETYNILKEYNVKGIMHCYSGSVEMATQFIKIGFYLGIGGISTFKNASRVVEVIKGVPLEYIVLETDSPYLSPEPYRGKKNEPANILLVFNKICEIKKLDDEHVMNVLHANLLSLFDKDFHL